MTLKGKVIGKLEGDYTKDLLKVDLPAVTFSIAFIPVVITNKLVITSKLSGKAEADMETKFSLTTNNEYGLEYKGGFRKIATNNFSSTFDYEQHVKGSVRTGILIGLESMLYGAVGLTVNAGPALELNVAGSPIGIYVFDKGFRHDYIGYHSIWVNPIERGGSVENGTAGNEIKNAITNALNAGGTILDSYAKSLDRPIENEVSLKFGSEINLWASLKILKWTVGKWTLAESFTPHATLYRASFLPLFYEPEVSIADTNIKISSKIERDFLNYPVNDFGLCIEKAANECKNGGGIRRTFGSVKIGEKRSFETFFNFSDFENGDTYYIRPYFVTGLAPLTGTFYDKAIVYEHAIPMIDKRDGKAYKTTKIGTQVWMAENLDYAVADGSYCYDDDPANCEKYGRLYDMNASKIVCPAGWHLPDDDEWRYLLLYVVDPNSNTDVGTKLKATSGWGEYSNGTDYYGFAALPGGNWANYTIDSPNSAGYGHIGSHGAWWSASSSYNITPIYAREYSYMLVGWGTGGASLQSFGYQPREPNDYRYSIRCMQD